MRATRPTLAEPPAHRLGLTRLFGRPSRVPIPLLRWPTRGETCDPGFTRAPAARAAVRPRHPARRGAGDRISAGVDGESGSSIPVAPGRRRRHLPSRRGELRSPTRPPSTSVAAASSASSRRSGTSPSAQGPKRALAVFGDRVDKDTAVERDCHRIVHTIGSADLRALRRQHREDVRRRARRSARRATTTASSSVRSSGSPPRRSSARPRGSCASASESGAGASSTTSAGTGSGTGS